MNVAAEVLGRAHALTDFWRQIEGLTVEFREGIASRHESRAELARATTSLARGDSRRRARAEREISDAAGHKTPEDVEPDPELLDVAQAQQRSRAWHEGRAKGQRLRFRRREDCGETTLRSECGACGTVREMPDRCKVGRLCVSCRGKASAQRKERFGRARHAIVASAMKRGFFRHKQHGGRWGEKFLTLTVPHFEASEFRDPYAGPLPEGCRHTQGSLVQQRIECLFRAWRLFSLKLRKHWRPLEKRRGEPCRFYRAFEWTPGSDGAGHPHFHLWLFCPFLDRTLVLDWWRDSLRRAGLLTVDTYETLMVDIRAIHSRPTEFAHELIKRDDAIRFSRLRATSSGEDVIDYADGWTLAEVAEGRLLPKDDAAEVYKALEARRIVQTSRALLEELRTGCQDCGAEHSVRVRPVVLPELAKAEGHGRPSASGAGPPTQWATA